MRAPAKLLILISTTFFFGVAVVIFSLQQSPQKVFSVSPNIVISEVQVRSTTNADDEFVELYNSTGEAIDLTGWRLTKRTQTGTQSNLVASMSGVIPAKGYFLITSQEALASSSADQIYSTGQRIAGDNSVSLLGPDGTTLIDMVGMGAANSSETATIANPVNNGSVERKSQSSATELSMGIGGSDEFLGNGWDTDNNSTDFVQRLVSQPQNSQALGEPQFSPTPTGTSIPTPTEIPTPTSTQAPTATPTPTNTPTPIPSPTPTNTPTPSLTGTPSPSQTPTPTLLPSNTPTPTPTESHTPTPTITVTPTPMPSHTSTPTPTSTPVPSPTTTPSHPPRPYPPFTVACTTIYRTIRIPFGTFQISFPLCRIVRL